MNSKISYTQIVEEAKKLFPRYEETIRDIEYEAKGILYSEILFMLACLQINIPKRIIESGTARGQSTLLLSRALPEKEIISVEFDKNSPDVLTAKKRLENCKNVSLRFVDSRDLLPEIIQEGDVVIIDGPKMFLAVRLALRLLASGKVTGVFIHDTTKPDLRSYLPL